MDTGWCAIISFSMSEMTDLSLCCSFNKWTLQTLAGSSAFPITHLSSTFFFSLSLMTFLCILDEMTELRVCPSISYPTIMHLITQSLSSRSFILLFFSRSLPKACNYRPRCKTPGWDSICLSLITHSSLSHTHIQLSVWWTHAETQKIDGLQICTGQPPVCVHYCVLGLGIIKKEKNYDTSANTSTPKVILIPESTSFDTFYFFFFIR